MDFAKISQDAGQLAGERLRHRKDDMLHGGSKAVIVKLPNDFPRCSTMSPSTSRASTPGPEKRACVMRENPGMFEAREAKLGRCKQLARERGFTSDKGTGAGAMRDFVRDCVRGKQS